MEVLKTMFLNVFNKKKKSKVFTNPKLGLIESMFRAKKQTKEKPFLD